MSKILQIDSGYIAYMGIDGKFRYETHFYIGTEKGDYMKLDRAEVLDDRLPELGFTPEVGMEVDFSRDRRNRIDRFWPAKKEDEEE